MSGSEAGSSETDVQLVSLRVYSGRENPPPKIWPVHVGTPVTIRVEGMGPLHVVVFGPDGARRATTASPIVRDGSSVGTEQRFTPDVPGRYRVEHEEAAGSILAHLDAS